MRILIIGCGYVGVPLGQALASAGHEVHGIRRGAFAAEGITPHAIDITRREALASLHISTTLSWTMSTIGSSCPTHCPTSVCSAVT